MNGAKGEGCGFVYGGGLIRGYWLGGTGWAVWLVGY